MMKKVLFLVLLLGCGKYREIKLPTGQENKYEHLLCEKAENECGLFSNQFYFGRCVYCLSAFYELNKNKFKASKEDVYNFISEFDCKSYEQYYKEFNIKSCINGSDELFE